jgi:S1-C subfamily serine protease
MTLQSLTPDAVSRFGLEPGDQGLLVSRINPAGAAANAGIRQGDLIQEVNRKQVRTVADFAAAIQQSGARPALLLVKRRDQTVYVTLRQDS